MSSENSLQAERRSETPRGIHDLGLPGRYLKNQHRESTLHEANIKTRVLLFRGTPLLFPDWWRSQADYLDPAFLGYGPSRPYRETTRVCRASVKRLLDTINWSQLGAIPWGHLPRFPSSQFFALACEWSYTVVTRPAVHYKLLPYKTSMKPNLSVWCTQLGAGPDPV